MRTKHRHQIVAASVRTTQPAPSLVKLQRKNCHAWRDPQQGMVYIDKDRIYKLARVSGMLGESIEKLAARVGVPRRILGQWMIKNPKIRKHMQRGMDVMVVEVERAAIKRACGYDHPRKCVTTKRDISGKVVERNVTHETVHIPGDPSMQRYILDRRAKKRYAKDENVQAQVLIHIDQDDDKL